MDDEHPPNPLIEATPRGLYCAAGDFYIDPWRSDQPVDRAVITHAHADHLQPGHRRYLCSASGEAVVRQRVQPDARIEAIPFGQTTTINDVRVSLHPAGHLLGSAQVRVEHRGEVWVVSGDYKTRPDATCEPFELVKCHTFITESTFGLPVYCWPPEAGVFGQINDWWRSNQADGRTSILFAYALGKAQRVLSGLDASIGPIIVHGAVQRFVKVYRAAGIALPDVHMVHALDRSAVRGKAMVVAPPSAAGTPWLRRFEPVSTGFASGWMRIRGTRRRRAMDRGFVLSDHADWPGLLATVEATGAERIGVTHGYSQVMVHWLREQGRDAFVVPTRYVGEAEGSDDAAEPADQPRDDHAAPSEGAAS